MALVLTEGDPSRCRYPSIEGTFSRHTRSPRVARPVRRLRDAPVVDATPLLTADGRVVCARCIRATRPWTRMRGLLGRTSLPQGEGMLFDRTSSVHTFFMRFPIDVVFADASGEVVSVREAVRPWRAVSQRGARWTLELAAGEAARVGLAEGARLRVGEP